MHMRNIGLKGDPLATGVYQPLPDIRAFGTDGTPLARIREALLNPCITRVTILIRGSKFDFIERLQANSPKLRLVCSHADPEAYAEARPEEYILL